MKLKYPFNQVFSESERVFVIAEIGTNHDGNLQRAIELIDAAAQCNADAVKFQSFLADDLVLASSQHHAMLKRLELQREWYPILKSEAENRGLVFFSTATNITTISWMEEVNVDLYKIASPNLTHVPLIRLVGETGKPAILSTGMAEVVEILEAIDAYRDAGGRSMAVLHCVSAYPADERATNLRSMQHLSNVLGPEFPIGFSDHSTSITLPAVAVGAGARIIEKHFTYDRTADGPDHHFALEPKDFSKMTQAIREAEKALGSGRKEPAVDELPLRHEYRRSLHIRRDMIVGETLGEDDLYIVRPADGLHPRHVSDVVGMKIAQSIKAGTALTWQHFKFE